MKNTPNFSEDLILPEPPVAIGNYTLSKRSGNLLFLSGMLPIKNGEAIFIGKLGEQLGVEEGAQAARLCALNLLAVIKESLGGLDRIESFLSLSGFVNASANFTQIPQVINGASDLIFEVLGKKRGMHTRAAVGVVSLPKGVAVELQATIEIVSSS